VNLIRGLHANVSSFADPALSSYYYWLESWTMKRADLVICNGTDTRDYVRSLGISAIAVPNGVDYKRFNNKDQSCPPELQERDKYYILMAASLMHVKGIDDALCAARICKDKRMEDIRFIFVGKGSAVYWLAKARELGVENLVRFIGERKDIPAYYRYADAALTLCHFNNVTPKGGGVSMSLLEAMAAGKPIIAYDNPIFNTIVQDQQTALLVSEHNPETIVAAITFLHDNPQFSARIASRALMEAKQYDWPVIGALFLDRLSDLTRRPPDDLS